MPLFAGTSFGPYKSCRDRARAEWEGFTERRSRDLDRDVAAKGPPQSLSADADARRSGPPRRLAGAGRLLRKRFSPAPSRPPPAHALDRRVPRRGGPQQPSHPFLKGRGCPALLEHGHDVRVAVFSEPVEHLVDLG